MKKGFGIVVSVVLSCLLISTAAADVTAACHLW